MLAHAGCPMIADQLPRWFVVQSYNPKGGISWAGAIGALCILGGVSLAWSGLERDT